MFKPRLLDISGYSGIQKLGILLSIIWVLGSLFYQFKETESRAISFSEWSYNSCLRTNDLEGVKNDENCVEKKKDSYEIFTSEFWGNALFFALFPVPFFWIYSFCLIKFGECISIGSKVVGNFEGFSRAKKAQYYFCFGFTGLSLLFLIIVSMNIYVRLKVPAHLGYSRSVSVADGYVTAEGTWKGDITSQREISPILYPQHVSKIVCKLEKKECVESRAIISSNADAQYLMSDLIEYDIQSWTKDAIVFSKYGICYEEVYTIELNSKTVNGVEKFVDNSPTKGYCKDPGPRHRFNTFILENGFAVHRSLTREASPWLLKVVFSLFGN